MGTIRVLIAEDHAVVREGLRMLLAQEKDIEVVGEAEDGQRALLLTERLRPDVVVMDVALPIMNGVEATRRIRQRFPASRILVLSSYSDEELVSQLLENVVIRLWHMQTA